MPSTESLHRCFIALGSNLGDTRANLSRLRNEISDRIGDIVNASQVITTQPEGFESKHLFSNQVIEVSTSLTPQELLHVSQSIERDAGRKTKSYNGTYTDRIADIDLILYDDLIINEGDLIIPHPQYRVRSFVLDPLCEIAPNMVDPQTGESIMALVDQLHTNSI